MPDSNRVSFESQRGSEYCTLRIQMPYDCGSFITHSSNSNAYDRMDNSARRSRLARATY